MLRRWLVTVCASTLVLCGGCAPDGDTERARESSPVTERPVHYAPYVDVTLSGPRLTDVADATGQRVFTLAFALAKGDRCSPWWGGIRPLDDPEIVGEVERLRRRGGEVVVATGGADGPYLENACRTVDDLTTAYERALDAAGSNRLDVDLEATVPVERVVSAMARLQQRRGTALTLTLPVHGQRTGLAADGLAVVRAAARHGLEVTVNAMVMNFPYTGDWGEAMTSAADATVAQLRTVWPDEDDAALYRMLGLTAMIGRNDSGMVTTQDAARTLLAYARSHQVGFLGFWSVARDNGCRQVRVAGTCSGITQQPYEFTKMFRVRARQP